MKKAIIASWILCLISTWSLAFAEAPTDINAQGQACFDTAVDYRDDQADGPQALEAFIKAYETGYDHADEAAVEIAWLYDNDDHGVPEDLVQGTLWLERAADLGNSEAMTHLSMHYLWGKGVDADMAKAAAFAEQGLTAATDDSDRIYAYKQLVRIYRTPDTEWTSAEKAAAYSEELVALGAGQEADDLWELALLYDSDALKDTTKAIVYYEAYIATGSEQHHAEAMWRCGWLWYYEMNIHPNGLAWMKQSAEAEDADGMFCYAEALEKFENDPDTAMLWYQKAATAGNANAQARLAELSAE